MIKKYICIIAAIILGINASATIADPTPVTVKQPDGSSIVIFQHGDEFKHWITDVNGNILKIDKDGWYRLASEVEAEPVTNSSVKPVPMTRANASPEYASSSISIGKKRFLVLLIEFPDLKFTVANANQAFSNMLNQQGYSGNGGTGSVYDYYYENSRGAFDPTYDVIGPIMVSRSYSYYGKEEGDNSDLHPDELLIEACDSANNKYPDLDFSVYDIDGNGDVDNVFYYFAGHNQAEGADANTIWPHSWNVYASNIGYKNQRFDNVRVYHYACSSEYKGSSGTNMCGIGTFCHEFGHVLGLPDFYDTDYSTNGQSKGLMHFSLMSSGNYNNSGRTPPYLNTEERYILGWMGGAEEWTTFGVKNIAGIQNNVAYKINTTNSGEYFQFETRTGTGWDAYIGKGLLIYHVDKSSNNVHGTKASTYWSNGRNINIYSDHPCFHIEPAKTNYTSEDQVPFAGTSGITFFDDTKGAVDWAGNKLGKYLKDITQNTDKTITATLYRDVRYISGTVKDNNGQTIEGASVNIVETGTTQSTVTYSSVTESDGAYNFELDANSGTSFKLTVSCHGYADYSESFTISASSTVKNSTLNIKTSSSSDNTVLKKYSDNPNYQDKEVKKITLGETAIKLEKSLLADYAGCKILGVEYIINATTLLATNVLTIIYAGDTQLVRHDVNDVKANTLYYDDLSSKNLTIPKDKDLYVGYALEIVCKKNHFIVDGNKSVQSGGFLARSKTSDAWSEQNLPPLVISLTVEKPVSGLDGLGYGTLVIEKGGKYSAGTEFKPSVGTSVKSYTWSIDGVEKSGAVTLTKGEHVIRVEATLAGGEKETIYQEISVE